MKLEDIVDSLGTMSEEELIEFVQDVRRNRQTVNETKIKAVKKQTAGKNLKALIASMSIEERAEFVKSLKGE